MPVPAPGLGAWCPGPPAGGTNPRFIRALSWSPCAGAVMAPAVIVPVSVMVPEPVFVMPAAVPARPRSVVVVVATPIAVVVTPAPSVGIVMPPALPVPPAMRGIMPVVIPHVVPMLERRLVPDDIGGGRNVSVGRDGAGAQAQSRRHSSCSDDANSLVHELHPLRDSSSPLLLPQPVPGGDGPGISGRSMIFSGVVRPGFGRRTPPGSAGPASPRVGCPGHLSSLRACPVPGQGLRAVLSPTSQSNR